MRKRPQRKGNRWLAGALAGAKLVVAAGGDGAVTKVALALRSTDPLIAIVRLGKANNIARAWHGEELVPVVKAYSGFTDEELVKLDRWVRNHTVERFGPVRSVEPGLVLEIAFDSVHEWTRHKSGLAMRFPRVHRTRWDEPVKEADTVETLAS